MSWLTGWILRTIPPGRLAKSSTSARSVQKTSGLFNDGPADDLKSSFKPSAQSDLLSGDDALMLGLDSGMLSYLDPLAEASLDSFVDLNTFFNEGKSDEPMDGAAEIDALIAKTKPIEVAGETDAATPSMKRKFEEVVEVVDVVDMEEEVVIATTPDHDYVSKRPRLSTSSNTSEVSVASTSTATSRGPINHEHKYRERRNKNNVASRRSREIRKQKFTDMEAEADRLIVDNEKLEGQIVELEKLAKEMKAILVAKLAGK